MKIAVVAIIRDEAADILSWIGWYRAQGVDTVIIFDDGSTDGTDILIENAGKCFDVRLFKVKPDQNFYTVRQELTYRHALQTFRDEFDWIGFLDADEYVAVYKEGGLRALLADTDPTVGTLAINWCNYGSSNHVTKPVQPNYLAFEYHYRPEERINHHVKSFIRPSCWTGSWRNVHAFDTGQWRCVNPEMQDVVWSDTFGITATAPSWTVAKIMHYQIRSMEHYVERIKKRPDISESVQAWINADHNDVLDTRPQLYASEIDHWLGDVVQQTGVRIISNIRSPHDVLTPPPIQEVHLKLVTIERADGGYIHEKDNDHDEQNEPEEARLLGLLTPDNTLFLFRTDGRIPKISYETRHSPFLTYRVIPRSRGIALQHTRTKRFVTALPEEHGGDLFVNRTTAQGWEEFHLHDITAHTLGQTIFQTETFRLLARALTAPITLDAIRHLSGAGIMETNRLLPVLAAFLKPEEQKILYAAFGGAAKYVF